MPTAAIISPVLRGNQGYGRVLQGLFRRAGNRLQYFLAFNFNTYATKFYRCPLSRQWRKFRLADALFKSDGLECSGVGNYTVRQWVDYSVTHP